MDRIILEKNDEKEHAHKAVAVEAHNDTNGQSMIIKARKEIILSAGYDNLFILVRNQWLSDSVNSLSLF